MSAKERIPKKQHDAEHEHLSVEVSIAAAIDEHGSFTDIARIWRELDSRSLNLLSRKCAPSSETSEQLPLRDECFVRERDIGLRRILLLFHLSDQITRAESDEKGPVDASFTCFSPPDFKLSRSLPEPLGARRIPVASGSVTASDGSRSATGPKSRESVALADGRVGAKLQLPASSPVGEHRRYGRLLLLF